MEVAIISVAVTHGAVLGELSPATKQQWGFGLHDFGEGRSYTIITSTFFVRDLRMLTGILLLIGYSIGIYEWVAGTRRALLLYWSTNILATFLASWLLVALLNYAGSPLGRELAFMSDVGPSAGALGAIGGWVDRVPYRYRRWLFPTIMIYLMGKLALLPEPLADTIHLVAFPLGFALDRWPRLNRRGA
jgi:phosphatidylglycerol lysyltransferase